MSTRPSSIRPVGISKPCGLYSLLGREADAVLFPGGRCVLESSVPDWRPLQGSSCILTPSKHRQQCPVLNERSINI